MEETLSRIELALESLSENQTDILKRMDNFDKEIGTIRQAQTTGIAANQAICP